MPATKLSGPRSGLLTYPNLYRDPLRYLMRAANKYGDVMHMQLGRRHDVLLNHPDYVRAVLVDNENLRRCVHRPLRRILGNGLLTSRGATHKKQRLLLQPIFNRERITALGDIMAPQVVYWSKRWQDGGALDISDEMTRLTMFLTGKALFNVDFETKAVELRDALVTVLKATRFNNWAFASKQFEKLSLPAHQRFKRASAKLDAQICAMIAERRESDCDGPDMLSILVHFYKRSRKGITEQKIRDQILTFFIVGHETTATGLMWTWYLLSLHPAVAKKLHREIDRVLGGRLPAMKDLNCLQYTRMVIAESMRLYPPIWILSRRATRDVKMNGFVLRSGWYAHVSPFLMHHDGRFFSDPERFDPERWTAEAVAARPKFSYFPFGGGPLQCIGEGFAWLQSILVVSILAREWEMRVVPGHRIELEPEITLSSRHGMPMILERRK
jgi:cytochrome P450